MISSPFTISSSLFRFFPWIFESGLAAHLSLEIFIIKLFSAFRHKLDVQRREFSFKRICFVVRLGTYSSYRVMFFYVQDCTLQSIVDSVRIDRYIAPWSSWWVSAPARKERLAHQRRVSSCAECMIMIVSVKLFAVHWRRKENGEFMIMQIFSALDTPKRGRGHW